MIVVKTLAEILAEPGLPRYSVDDGEYDYVRVSDIKDVALRQRFEKWLDGQTRPVFPGIDDAAYVYDWSRFCLGYSVDD